MCLKRLDPINQIASMTLAEMVRHNRFAVAVATIFTVYFLSQALFNSSIVSISTLFDKTAALDICLNPQFQWRGANEKIYPRSGQPIHVKHNDYTKGLVNFDTSVYMARALDEEFSIEVEIFTSLDLPAEDFEITYNRDEYIINSMIPQNSEFITAEETKDKGHCIVMKIHLMIPVSKPLSGLKVEFPKANVYLHDSLWGSVPYLDIDVAQGAIIFSDEQRFHVESTSIKLDSGKVLGKLMLTKSLDMHVREGLIDVEIGYSPYLVGASIDVFQMSGSQNIKLQALFYRPTTGAFELQDGKLKIEYPGSYHGAISIDSQFGDLKLSGDSVVIQEQSGDGVKPAWVEATHGMSRTVKTKVRHGSGSVEMKVNVPKGKARVLLDDESGP